MDGSRPEGLPCSSDVDVVEEAGVTLVALRADQAGAVQGFLRGGLRGLRRRRHSHADYGHEIRLLALHVHQLRLRLG